MADESETKKLIAQAERKLSSSEWGQADPEGSTACSLLAIAKMLEDTIERERVHDALIEQNDRMDATLGRLSDELRALSGDLPTEAAERLGNIIREAGL